MSNTDLNVLSAEQKNLKNSISIDWLSLNFKNVDAKTLLMIFCEATKDTNVSFENFIYNENRGFVTGYTHSYSYLNTPYIVLSFCPNRSEMGVNLQITGQGCKFIYFEDIKKFLELSSALTQDYKCNRLDIAYDDFERVIPVADMVEATEKDLNQDNGIRTIISRIKRDMISIYTNHWNGSTTKNLLFGKHRSARSFRLYDKRLEQKREDIDYWYRLEIELRTKGKSFNADEAFKEFISGKSMFEIFLDNISTIVSFTRDYKSTNTDFPNFKLADFWVKFIDYLTSHNVYCAKYIDNSTSQEIIRDKKPTVLSEFLRTFRSFLNQYGSFLCLLDNIDSAFIYKILLNCRSRFQDNLKYQIFYNFFNSKSCFEQYALVGGCFV